MAAKRGSARRRKSPKSQPRKAKRQTALGFISFWHCSPLVSETYYQQNLTGVVDGITRSEYPLMLKNVEGVLTGQNAPYHFLRENPLAGAVVMAPRMKKRDLKILEKVKIPIVLLYHRTEGKEFSWVDLNNREGGRLATEHLLGLGHRRIGFIGGELELSSNARDRYEAYQKALQSAGILEDPRLVRNGFFSMDFGKESAGEMLSLPASQRPTALFCATDMTAFGAIETARRMGLKIPQDLSIMGFDNYDQAAYYSPPLTTIDQPFYEMGRIAVELLESILEDPRQDSRQILIEPELIVRGSTGPPPLAPPGHKTSTF